jgi:MFS superfamily sulfate permease-like transporter
LLILQRTAFKPLSALAVVAGAALWGAAQTDATLPSLSLGLSLPQLQLPDWDSTWVAGETVLLPQLALTVTNAALVTAAIAGELFPRDRERITPDRLALSSGALNLLLAPLGAFPMCHGAGGLVVQHKFGARTGLAPALFGATCLSLGLFLGTDALALLSLLPLAAVGALLVLAGADLALNKQLRQARPDCLFVIALTGLICVTVNVAVGLLAGLLVESVRSFATRRRSEP